MKNSLELMPYIFTRPTLTTESGKQYSRNLYILMRNFRSDLSELDDLIKENAGIDTDKLEGFFYPLRQIATQFIGFWEDNSPENQVNGLTLTAKVLGAKYGRSTALFKEMQNAQDDKVWDTCKNLLLSPDSYAETDKTKSELNQATANVVQVIEQSDDRSRYRIFEMSQRIKGNALFPLPLLKFHVKQELTDLAKITKTHYESLQDYYE